MYSMLKEGLIVRKIYKNNVHILGGPVQYNYGSAGIIPYSKKNDEIYLLFNKNNKNVWTYFGGHRELIDGNSPKRTAIREAFEESYDIIINRKHLPVDKKFNSNEEINNLLRKGKFYIIPKFNESKKNWNNIYFVKINMDQWIKDHNGYNYYVFDGINNSVLNDEVREIRWFKFNEIFDIIKQKKLVNFISVIILIYIKEIKNFK